VVSPDGEIVPDIEARLPGRGLWLTPRRDIVERAIAKRLFARAARRPVAIRPELVERVEALLVRRCCDLLGLGRRAGEAVAGFDRVEDALRRGRVGLLLTALDAAEGSRRRLAHSTREPPEARVLSGTELGFAFGRERVVHAAVAPGGLCGRLTVELGRAAGFRAGAAAVVDRRKIAPGAPEPQDGGIVPND